MTKVFGGKMWGCFKTLGQQNMIIIFDDNYLIAFS